MSKRGGSEYHQSRVPVLLLKTKSSPTDGYEEYLCSLNNGLFRPIFVPVLEHRFKQDSLAWLESMIAKGGLSCSTHFSAGSDATGERIEQFGGVIFTSQRAVEAFTHVVKAQDKQGLHRLLPAILDWFVVGPATARGLNHLKDDTSLECTISGEETGNGQALAQFILETYHKPAATDGRRSANRLPLLFLVGEQRRDIIPKTLESPSMPEDERIRVTETIVYETGEMQSFQGDFGHTLRKVAETGVNEQWIVVFSPTGGKAMLSSLGWLDEASGCYDSAAAQQSNTSTYVATIGPTTRDYLIEEFGFRPHVCAEKPSAEGVGKAIEDFRAAIGKD